MIRRYFKSVANLVSDVKNGTMDHQGQRLAAKLMAAIIAGGVTIALAVGTVTRRFEDMVKIVTISAIVALVVNTPPDRDKPNTPPADGSTAQLPSHLGRRQPQSLRLLCPPGPHIAQ